MSTPALLTAKLFTWAVRNKQNTLENEKHLEPKNGGGWKMMFLFNWVMFRWWPREPREFSRVRTMGWFIDVGCLTTNYLTPPEKTGEKETWQIHQIQLMEIHSMNVFLRRKKSFLLKLYSYLRYQIVSNVQGYYTSSHNHGSQKWVPPIVVTFQV